MSVDLLDQLTKRETVKEFKAAVTWVIDVTGSMGSEIGAVRDTLLEFANIFEKKYNYLQDINIDTFLFVSEALQISSNFKKTSSYTEVLESNDFRNLAAIKTQPKNLVKPYIQMFDDKHGFLPNLSILDLLFMEGPNAISFLEKNV